MKLNSEPTIAVGLVDGAKSIAFRLLNDYKEQKTGQNISAGSYTVKCRQGKLEIQGETKILADKEMVLFSPGEKSRFSIETTIGIDFHWQQKEIQTFSGELRLLARRDDLVVAINNVALESYLSSVICSEMSASAPPSFIRCHAVISRSWLLAQLGARENPLTKTISHQETPAEIIRWYDRENHHDFDVCADDHCQRYQGVDRIQSPEVLASITDTRGQVITFNQQVCDARFSKCCGGVSEDYRTAWDDTYVPYLVPIFDGPDKTMPKSPLTEEKAAEVFIKTPPTRDIYCNCNDPTFLKTILPSYDQKTVDFFRWKKEISSEQARELILLKTKRNLGRIMSIEPMERGPSGRIKRLRLVGEAGSLIIGKELEIRRALSQTHLYSSAFVVEKVGPADRPSDFVLHGAGWGHGVGLCQIGAALMAHHGINYLDILRHYYPGTEIRKVY